MARPVPQVTNEPGYYEDGEFGIRIENVLLVQTAQLPNNFGGVGYLGFETVTLVPMQAKLIDVSLLTAAERAWVDAYHAQCRQTLRPLLVSGSPAERWLLRWTEPLVVS